MVRSAASRVSNHEAPIRPSFETPRKMRGPQDEADGPRPVAKAGQPYRVCHTKPSPCWSQPYMTAIRGAAAAVTGAASGIGRALAIELAARGCDLALADRDEAGLQSVAAEIGRTGSQKVSIHRVDVSEPGQIAEFAQAAIKAHPGLNILVNNAGVALLGQFHEVDQAQMDWLMNINFWGVVHSTRAFLGHLATRSEAHIVNISSIFGVVAPPGNTAYSAAKFAVRGFSESLRHELQMASSPIRLSVVHPGGVLTNIVRNSRAGSLVADNERRAQTIERFDALAQTTPRDAALTIIKGIEKNRPRILIGGDARFMDIIQRFRPEAVGVQQVRGGGEHVGCAVAEIDVAVAVEIDAVFDVRRRQKLRLPDFAGVSADHLAERKIAALHDLQRRDQFALEQFGAAAIMRHGREHAKHRQPAHVAFAEIGLQPPDRDQYLPRHAELGLDARQQCRMPLQRRAAAIDAA